MTKMICHCQVESEFSRCHLPQITFESHPVPSDLEVTWHLGDRFMTPGLEAMEADSEDDLPVQFEAHGLEYRDHDSVTARLTINYLTLEVDTNFTKLMLYVLIEFYSGFLDGLLFGS